MFHQNHCPTTSLRFLWSSPLLVETSSMYWFPGWKGQPEGPSPPPRRGTAFDAWSPAGTARSRCRAPNPWRQRDVSWKGRGFLVGEMGKNGKTNWDTWETLHLKAWKSKSDHIMKKCKVSANVLLSWPLADIFPLGKILAKIKRETLSPMFYFRL